MSVLAEASVFGVDVPAIPAAYAVMWVRTSISFARVASSIIVDDFAVVPLVPVGVGVEGVEDDSVATISLMILSMAATSVPQFDFDASGFAVSVGEALGDEPSFSRFERCFFRSAIEARFFAGTDVASIEFTAA